MCVSCNLFTYSRDVVWVIVLRAYIGGLHCLCGGQVWTSEPQGNHMPVDVVDWHVGKLLDKYCAAPPPLLCQKNRSYSLGYKHMTFRCVLGHPMPEGQQQLLWALWFEGFDLWLVLAQLRMGSGQFVAGSVHQIAAGCIVLWLETSAIGEFT